MIAFWAFIYRVTGWYSPWARVAEYEAIREFLDRADWTIDDNFAGNSASNRVSIEIGSWQAANGFYRKWKK